LFFIPSADLLSELSEDWVGLFFSHYEKSLFQRLNSYWKRPLFFELRLGLGCKKKLWLAEAAHKDYATGELIEN
jgi:hypothetical protein